jgi:lipoprotein-anchoring transpeptidase ErfK/SrfK
LIDRLRSRDTKDAAAFALGESVVPSFNPGAVSWRRALVASAGLALVSATPATAYQGWFYGPPASIMEPEQRPHPVNRRAIREQKARKLLAQKGAPEKLPPGQLHIVISIKKQQLTLYAGGVPVAHSRVSTGVPGHPTPQGVFSILEKRIYHESNIYSSAPMPYMQRITWSGVAMHQGVVPNHPASHGCIRLPPDFARRLWGITRVGARVIIAQDDVTLAEIEAERDVMDADVEGISTAEPSAATRGEPVNDPAERDELDQVEAELEADVMDADVEGG